MPTFDVEVSHPVSGARSLITVEAIDAADARDEVVSEHRGYRVLAVKPSAGRSLDIPAPRPEFIPGAGMIICPNVNCGYRGPARRQARGNRVVLILLLVFFVVPGLLYLLFFRGWRYYCPRCGLQIATDTAG